MGRWLNKIITKKSKIIHVRKYNEYLQIFFDNGKVIIILNNDIFKIIDLKLNNANLVYFQNNKMFISLKNGKTTVF